MNNKEHSNTGTAIFAAGCFWGVQHQFDLADGVVESSVGYIGGARPEPSYEQVCTGATGHQEAVLIKFDPEITNFEELTKVFFEIHDFEQTNGQGPDIGSQYFSVIFYQDETQKKQAQEIITQLTQMGYKVATKLKEASTFWPAEAYHQNYYQKTGKQPYCHLRRKIF